MCDQRHIQSSNDIERSKQEIVLRTEHASKSFRMEIPHLILHDMPLALSLMNSGVIYDMDLDICGQTTTVLIHVAYVLCVCAILYIISMHNNLTNKRGLWHRTSSPSLACGSSTPYHHAL